MVLTTDEDLVLADALQLAGDPRGELIVVEIQLARDPRPDLYRRRAELVATHASTWWPELPAHRLRTRGGFVDAVVATADELARAVPLARRERVTSIELVDSPLAIPEPWRERLRHLTIIRGGAADMLDEMADEDQPFDWPLTSFAIRDAFLTGSHWSLGSSLPVCTHLDFADQALYETATRILGWDHLGQLEVLDLSGCHVDAMALDTILASRPAALRVLRLAGNRLGDGARPVLVKHLPNLPALARLELANSGITDDDLAAIAAAAPHVDVVGTYRRPARFTIDVGPHHVELVAAPHDAWSCELDGRHADIHVVQLQRDNRGVRPQPPERCIAAPVEQVVRALVDGQPLIPQLDGTISLALGAAHGTVYNTAVFAQKTARIEVTDHVRIDLEDYVSSD